MTIHRAPKPERGFRLARNSVSRDPRISLAAHGLLDYLLSFADDWEFHGAEGIARRVKDGVTAVRSAIKELEAAGYIHRVKCKDSKTGAFRWTWDIYDVPRTPDLAIIRFPVDGQPVDRAAVDGEPHDLRRLTKKTDKEDVMHRNVPDPSESGAPDSEPEIVDDADQEPDADEAARTAWRDQDRQRFADVVLVDTFISDGKELDDGSHFQAGRFSTQAVYNAMRKLRVKGEPIRYPGKYFDAVDKVGQLDEFFECRGLHRDWDSLTGNTAA